MKNSIQLLMEHALPPLTREKECELFHKLARLRRKKSYLILQRDVTTTIVRANIPLVISVAKKQQCPGISLEQFIAEGLTKLLKCVNTFDYTKNFRFSTYLYRSLIRMYKRFIQLELQRNRGKVNEKCKNEFFQYNYLTDDSIDLRLCDLRTAIQENWADLSIIELVLIKHTYNIGKELKTMNQLKLLMGSRMSDKQLQQVIAGAIEKLKKVLIDDETAEILA